MGAFSGAPMLKTGTKTTPCKSAAPRLQGRVYAAQSGQPAMSSSSASCFLTPFGWGGIVGGAAGLQRIYLPEPDRSALLDRMAAQFPGMSCGGTAFKKTVRELQKYFNGEAPVFDCPLDFASATMFQKKVWQEARAIGYGQVRSYGWLAQAIGSPQAMRAVGTALGRNPFPIIIPCHRVIREDGGPGGFSAVQGLELKKSLLQLEGSSIEKKSKF
jgi:methylated-DNA-[protein]-cysteine S-methyltransferase